MIIGKKLTEKYIVLKLSMINGIKVRAYSIGYLPFAMYIVSNPH